MHTYILGTSQHDPRQFYFEVAMSTVLHGQETNARDTSSAPCVETRSCVSSESYSIWAVIVTTGFDVFQVESLL